MISIRMPKIQYAPAGRCIYCGETRGLTDEHVLSHGLAGDSLILPKASCGKCQGATSKDEISCLRHMWWPFRTKMGVPARGRSPETFSLKRMRVDEYDPVQDMIVKYTKLGMEDLTPEQFPLFYQSFVFPVPGILASRTTSEDVEYLIWAKIDDSEFRKGGSKDREGFRLSPGRPEAFCRLLAKTAHCYAMAEFGTAVFEPTLTDYIRGKKIDRLQWIGSYDQVPASSALHQISFGQVDVDGVAYLEIGIRLFSCIGAPLHRVVVGRLHRPLNQSIYAALPVFEVQIEGEMPFQIAKVISGGAIGGWEG